MSSSKYRPVGYHPPAGDPHKRDDDSEGFEWNAQTWLIIVGVILLVGAGFVAMVLSTIAGSHIPLNMGQMDPGR